MSDAGSSRPRPTRIDLVTASIVERDAVGQHTIEAQKVLRSLGLVAEIYAVTMGPEMAGRARPIAELPRDSSGRQWLIYQASTGSSAAEAFAAHPGVKLLNYHNVTPPELVEPWMPSLGDELRLGRRQLVELSQAVDGAFADSTFNAEELAEWGYREATVSALMVDHANYDAPPDPARRAELEQAKSGGGSDWLFVGQFLPHKCQHDLVGAFGAYREAYDGSARLHLVGRASCPAYELGVRQLAGELGVADSVRFTGSVSATELAALYDAADVYVCCSEHEGFGAPLLEAMHHGVPVVAYGAAAVPETIDDAGVVLEDKLPATVAAAARRVVTDEELRERLVVAGRERSEHFTLERARREFAGTVTSLVAELA